LLLTIKSHIERICDSQINTNAVGELDDERQLQDRTAWKSGLSVCVQVNSSDKVG